MSSLSLPLPLPLFFTIFSLLFLAFSLAQQPSTPLLIPITKDHTTKQYTTTVSLKTPLKPTKLAIDLGFGFSWVNCDNTSYISSSYSHIPCNTNLCNSLHSLACSNCYEAPGPNCANDTCAMFPENSFAHTSEIDDAIIDVLAVSTAVNGRNPGSRLGVISDYLFSCSRSALLKGLAKGSSGVAGLGRSNFSIPAQVSSAFSDPFLFALCLSGSSSAPAEPYYFLPEIDLSKYLIYTPLILNPVGDTIITYYGYPSNEYFIGVTSVKVNGKQVPLNATLLTIDQETGFGGTKISTVDPYTVLQTSIYNAFTSMFTAEAAGLNLTVTKPVKPFKICYSADDVGNTRVGPAVPTIDLVLGSDDVFWRIFGANSMVRVARKNVDVWCLGFVDGGANPRTSIVIGGHQLEDNLLQFDVGNKRFGFSSSVLIHQTTCANFNFTVVKN
ncbi:Xylanase inhibitor, C-terminal [Dillenia turbinata]|uniref:Xylanase inhibitor, C-terminal n=1 Tax=Dillenia turbinata TaxID=194707 RepID=A0AAN8W3J3_9MAGN